MCKYSVYFTLLFAIIIHMRGEVTHMFKVEKTEYINKTFRMPKDLITELSELAQKKDISLNQLIIQCCRYSLDNLDETEG